MKFSITVKRPDGTTLQYETEAACAVAAVMTATGTYWPCSVKAVAINNEVKHGA